MVQNLVARDLCTTSNLVCCRSQVGTMVRSRVILSVVSSVFTRTDYTSEMLGCTLNCIVSTLFQALINSEFTLYIFGAV
jgi:hypothetical protein